MMGDDNRGHEFCFFLLLFLRHRQKVDPKNGNAGKIKMTSEIWVLRIIFCFLFSDPQAFFPTNQFLIKVGVLRTEKIWDHNKIAKEAYNMLKVAI